MINTSSVDSVKRLLEEEFKFHSAGYLENLFNNFTADKRTCSFINYYNRTVLDKERIRFGEFKHQWAIQGMKTTVIKYFDDNYDSLVKEILDEKNINNFYIKHCCSDRKEASFCSKLFHTIMPDEFPPLDNPIKKRFNLQKEDFVKSILIIKEAYPKFINENYAHIRFIRTLLSAPKYSYIRVRELSDIRILDMYFWFKENRLKSVKSLTLF